ncbi:hypothetical protein [Phyllobacterium ifriqiyense]
MALASVAMKPQNNFTRKGAVRPKACAFGFVAAFARPIKVA